MTLIRNPGDNTIESTDATVQLVGVAGTQLGIVQEVFVETTVDSSLTTALVPNDDTIPQTSETSLFSTLDLTITPTNASNILLFEYELHTACNTAPSPVVVWCMFKDAETDATKSVLLQNTGSTGSLHVLNFKHRVVAGGTSAQTWHLRAGRLGTTGVVDINRRAASPILGDTLISWARVTELLV